MNNIRPKERTERISDNSKETREKAFLSNRIGAYNKKSDPLKLNEPEPTSSLFINEAERFNKDFAVNEYERRREFNEKKRIRNETLRQNLFDKEQRRWEKMDYDYVKELNKAILNKEKNIVGKKNNPGLAFNLLTLEYDKSIQGEILRNRDDQAKYRAQLRSNNLDIHTNSQFNILTGEDRNLIKYPDKPKYFGQA